MNEKEKQYGNIRGYSTDSITLEIPVDISYIKDKVLKKIIEEIDVYVGFIFKVDEEKGVISIQENLLYHNQYGSLPSAWDQKTGDSVDDVEILKRDSGYTQINTPNLLLPSWEFGINSNLFGILTDPKLMSLGEVELILPLDFTCMKESSLHQNVKMMLESMELLVAFSFISQDDLFILVDDNVFGDIAFRGVEWSLKSQNFILGKPDDKGIIVYVSYSTRDSNKYKIAHISEEITKMPKILDVLYWEEDMKDDIYQYMNDNIKRCDIMLLFCSQNALNSEPVTMEWQAALKIKKRIIPIFTKESEIPALLSTKLGVFFEEDNIGNSITKIYNLILKKVDEN